MDYLCGERGFEVGEQELVADEFDSAGGEGRRRPPGRPRGHPPGEVATRTGQTEVAAVAELKPRLLAGLGRAGEALATVWADYCAHPDRFSFDQAEHRSKSSFMPRFQALVHDADPEPEPPFLDRATSRWTPPDPD